MGGSTYDYGLRETTYLDKIKSPRTTHEGGADINMVAFWMNWVGSLTKKEEEGRT